MNEKYKADIVKKMKAVNIYNKSFDHAIKVLTKTLPIRHRFREIRVYRWSIVIKLPIKTAQLISNNPLYLALEKLRDDILAYSKELGLTPAGLSRVNDELNKKDNKSKLSQVLSELTDREKT